jgi:hypothetical protein
LSGTDRVALDVEGVKIIQGYPGNSLAQLDPLEITQIKTAMAIGIGEVSQPDEILVGANVDV